MTDTRTVRRRKTKCPHSETIAIRIATISSVNTGLERVLCQTCGHASFRSLDDLTSPETTTTRSHPMRAANSLQTTSV